MKPQYPTAGHFSGWEPVYVGRVGSIDIYVSTRKLYGIIGFQEDTEAWWVYNANERRVWNFLKPDDGGPVFNPKYTKQAMEVGMAALNLML